MTGKRRTLIKRAATGMMCIMLLVIMVFSVFFIAIEADHHCTGDHCPICTSIAMCEAAIHNLSDGLSTQAAILAPSIFILIAAFGAAFTLPQKTPVSRKVRLNS